MRTFLSEVMPNLQIELKMISDGSELAFMFFILSWQVNTLVFAGQNKSFLNFL